MLVSRTNIKRLYWAICSLQSRAVVHNQFKCSSTLTFSSTQYPKPLNQGTKFWWTRSLTPDLSSKGSHGEVIHARTQCHSFSHTAGHKTPSPQPGEISSYAPGNKKNSSLLSCSAHLHEAYLEILPAHGQAPVPLSWDVVHGTHCDSVLVLCVSCHGFPNCLQSPVYFFITSGFQPISSMQVFHGSLK